MNPSHCIACYIRRIVLRTIVDLKNRVEELPLKASNSVEELIMAAFKRGYIGSLDHTEERIEEDSMFWDQHLEDDRCVEWKEKNDKERKRNAH